MLMGRDTGILKVRESSIAVIKGRYGAEQIRKSAGRNKIIMEKLETESKADHKRTSYAAGRVIL